MNFDGNEGLTVMDMNKTFFLNGATADERWKLLDAQDQVVGRLATHIASILRGKDSATFTRHCVGKTYVVVVNAEKIKFTGDKMKYKEYHSYTGWIGGLKILTAAQIMQKDPSRILYLAVKGMLPKESKQSRDALRRLKIYVGDQHPHQAQVATYSK